LVKVKKEVEYIIIGEVKSKISLKKIDEFIMSRIAPFKEEYKNILPVIVTQNVTTPWQQKNMQNQKD